MPKFRKVPVEIEARQLDGSHYGARAMCDWMATYGCEALRIFYGGWYEVRIRTLEGEMTARPGDWIVRGVSDEFYPCKPDIFAATYEDAALSQPVAEAVAWAAEDGRVISATQKATALRDGGASASSVAPFTIPLAPAVAQPGEVEP